MTQAAPASAQAPMPKGRPGDFDFLAGEWRIHNRRLEGQTWSEFPGGATVHTILDGAGSVEDLRLPGTKPAGMGLRLLDLERGVWSDFWVSARSGVLTTPGQEGSFVDGVGTFLIEDTEAKALYRGIWDRITPTSCRWYQSSSQDGGKTWVDNWYMDWARI